MPDALLSRIIATNERFAAFFTRSGEWLRGNEFARLEAETLALHQEIAGIGQSLGMGWLSRLGGESRSHVELYAANLRRLKEFFGQVQSHAGTRRAQLQAEARALEGSFEWCKAMKITVPD